MNVDNANSYSNEVSVSTADSNAEKMSQHKSFSNNISNYSRSGEISLNNEGQRAADKSAVFESLLTEMMQEGNTQISVKQVQITGPRLADRDGADDYDNLKELCERLGYMLDLLFIRNGIPKDPPVEIGFSYTSTEIQIKGDRDDIEELTRLISEDPDIVDQINNVLTLAGSLINIAESLRFQSEYRTSDDPEAIVSKYSHLFEDGREVHKAILSYGDGLSLVSDGNIYSL
ncbi:hypothetical protein Dacet_0313 [Denitrovibrio acetiphilus DSM 12809]|uniref:Uncharacterized protein n=1 Tax=Denitrovibrio acetiphilus (strain DSM 12809 / NBRC 114555 / N2460) TaxID=522772 RepID=D4H2Q2_DENA2|nr:hypothetical protein [Denitrovibrio acetiphilus]ADD67113.1 hypothetical protein Dacet_0313 [Denitrovibrio acetiphilus DSM 12809]